MRGANRTPLNRLLLTCWRISAFEDVPADYQQTLDEMVKAYPSPARGFELMTLHSLLNQTKRLISLGPEHKKVP
jgi:hypothetical protein